MSTEFDLKKHVGFFKYMINVLPTPYQSQDSNRMTLLYFCVAALDIMNQLESSDMRNHIIEFVYNMQVLPDSEDPTKNVENCGFRGGNFFGNKWNPQCVFA